jgi:hypothetical protein
MVFREQWLWCYKSRLYCSRTEYCITSSGYKSRGVLQDTHQNTRGEAYGVYGVYYMYNVHSVYGVLDVKCGMGGGWGWVGGWVGGGGAGGDASGKCERKRASVCTSVTRGTSVWGYTWNK